MDIDLSLGDRICHDVCVTGAIIIDAMFNELVLNPVGVHSNHMVLIHVEVLRPAYLRLQGMFLRVEPVKALLLLLQKSGLR